MSSGPLSLTHPLQIDGAFGSFADQLLAEELPDLADARRHSTVEFVCRRAGALPSPLLIGVTLLSIGLSVAMRVGGRARTTAWLRRTTLPFVGELARMVRSLGFTYVWETWPDTTPSGAVGATP